MFTFTRISKTIGIVILLAVFTACSDSSTNTEVPDPPQLPDLQQYQPDTDYFSSNSTQGKTVQAEAAFNLAAQMMQTTVGPLFSTTQFYLPFFAQAEQSDPEYKDGVWEWTYSYAQYEQSAEIRLTAEPSQDGSEFSWDLFISASSSQGQSFDNYRFMDGASASDGSEGSWSIYPYEAGGSSSPVVTFDWTREDENNYTASYNIDSPNFETAMSLTYTEEGAEHTLVLTSGNGEIDFKIYWNTDTDTGYVTQLGDQMCWDSGFNNVPCQ